MNIVDLTSQYVELKKAGSKFTGACPKCPGNKAADSFVVNPAKGFAHCYVCGGNWDVIRFLKAFAGLSCPDAHRKAAIECDQPMCPVWEKCSRGLDKHACPGSTVPAGPSLPSDRHPAYAAGQPDNPAEVWQQHAGDYVALCHQRLLECPDQLAYLAGRGLSVAAVQRYRLGWVPAIEFKNRKAWGLPDKPGKGDKVVKVLPFPQGILLPWIVAGRIHRLRLRRSVVTGTEPRYLWIDGSGNDIICLNHSAAAHCVVESDLDGLLIDHLAGDLVGAIPLGSCSTKPKATIMDLLINSQRILVAMDYDHEHRGDKLHAPGARASHWWFKEFPDTARRWPVPVGKDPGEAFAAGADLRAWIIKGLPAALQIKAFLPAIVSYAATSKPVDPQKPPQENNNSEDHIIKHDHHGRPYCITSSPQEYHRLRDQGLVVFSTKELKLAGDFIGLAKEQGQLAADCIMQVKQIFKGSFIKSVTVCR